jgi:hypothetical protein
MVRGNARGAIMSRAAKTAVYAEFRFIVEFSSVLPAAATL